jgi:hypothetical protein
MQQFVVPGGKVGGGGVEVAWGKVINDAAPRFLLLKFP